MINLPARRFVLVYKFWLVGFARIVLFIYLPKPPFGPPPVLHAWKLVVRRDRQLHTQQKRAEQSCWWKWVIHFYIHLFFIPIYFLAHLYTVALDNRVPDDDAPCITTIHHPLFYYTVSHCKKKHFINAITVFSFPASLSPCTGSGRSSFIYLAAQKPNSGPRRSLGNWMKIDSSTDANLHAWDEDIQCLFLLLHTIPVASAVSWRTIGLPFASCQGNYGHHPPRLPSSRKKKKNCCTMAVWVIQPTCRALYCIILSSPGKEKRRRRNNPVLHFRRCAFASCVTSRNTHTHTNTYNQPQLWPAFSLIKSFSSVLLPLLPSQYFLCAVRVLATPLFLPVARLPASWLAQSAAFPFCYYTFHPIVIQFSSNSAIPLFSPFLSYSTFDCWFLVICASSCHREDRPVLLPSNLAIKRTPPIHSPCN